MTSPYNRRRQNNPYQLDKKNPLHLQQDMQNYKVGRQMQYWLYPCGRTHQEEGSKMDKSRAAPTKTNRKEAWKRTALCRAKRGLHKFKIKSRARAPKIQYDSTTILPPGHNECTTWSIHSSHAFRRVTITYPHLLWKLWSALGII